MDERSGAKRSEERQPMDPTRKLLKVFGVKVTDYEERTDDILRRYKSASAEADRAALVREAAELTADLAHWLREVQSHVLERQERVLSAMAGDQGH